MISGDPGDPVPGSTAITRGGIVNLSSGGQAHALRAPIAAMDVLWLWNGRILHYRASRKDSSAESRGSSDTGWSRQTQRIISGSIAPPMSWLCTPIPHE